MKEFISKYQKAVVGTGAVAVLIVCYLQQKELAKLRIQASIHKEVGVPIEGDSVISKLIYSLERENDSLTNELFIERVDGARHEITREEILSKYPKVAKEYDEFYNHNTE